MSVVIVELMLTVGEADKLRDLVAADAEAVRDGLAAYVVQKIALAAEVTE